MNDFKMQELTPEVILDIELRNIVFNYTMLLKAPLKYDDIRFVVEEVKRVYKERREAEQRMEKIIENLARMKDECRTEKAD